MGALRPAQQDWLLSWAVLCGQGLGEPPQGQRCLPRPHTAVWVCMCAEQVHMGVSVCVHKSWCASGVCVYWEACTYVNTCEPVCTCVGSMQVCPQEHVFHVWSLGPASASVAQTVGP